MSAASETVIMAPPLSEEWHHPGDPFTLDDLNARYVALLRKWADARGFASVEIVEPSAEDTWLAPAHRRLVDEPTDLGGGRVAVMRAPFAVVVDAAEEALRALFAEQQRRV